MNGRKLLFTGVRQLQVEPMAIPEPAGNQLRVDVQYSAISPGTELLLYRGQLPKDLQLDTSIEALAHGWQYPVAYGYASVGIVSAIGKGVAGSWLGQRVFAFQPHASHFVANPEAVMPVPEGISMEDALFLPNMETAVSLVMDGRPVIGEQVLVIGQGVVGLLTACLLGQMPLAALVVADNVDSRRKRGHAFAGAIPHSAASLQAAVASTGPVYDLAYELSGNPEALNLAIAVTADYGRIVIGSWYGEKRAAVDLGGRFHRSHMTLISSQVSEMKPAWTGRWTKARRLGLAWQMIRKHNPSRLISHSLPVEQAGTAYQMLDAHPEDCLQILLTY